MCSHDFFVELDISKRITLTHELDHELLKMIIFINVLHKKKLVLSLGFFLNLDEFWANPRN